MMKTTLTAILFASMLLSAALAQSIGLVTDTNGNIVSRRTNTLTFTNRVTWATNVVAATRTNLFTGGLVPSGAATSGSSLQADGSGGSSFVASRTQTVSMSSSAFRTNTTDNTVSVNGQTNMVLNLDANSNYFFAFALITTSSTTGGFNARLVHSDTTNGLRNTYVGRMGRPINIAASDITAGTTGSIPLQAVNFAGTNVVTTGTGIIATGSGSGTLTLVWYQSTATNAATELVAGSMMTVTKINP